MRKLLFLLFLTMMLSCQENNFEEYLVSYEECDYLPSPCDLITVDELINISDDIPFPTPNSYELKSASVLLAEINDPGASLISNTCEFSFEDELTRQFSMYGHVTCRNGDDDDPLRELTVYSQDYSYADDEAFPDAIYFYAINAYVVRKENYILELKFGKYTKAQQIEIVEIMLANLP